jgi:hypothetical protein
MNTSYLTWPEARALAQLGQLIRREAGTTWLRRAAGGLWQVLNASFVVLRVVSENDFLTEDYYAEDWTTDPIGTVRDVCARRAAVRRFIPPGLGLSGEITGTTSLSLTADLGETLPSGSWTLAFYFGGTHVGDVEAPEPGRYSQDVEIDYSAFGTASSIETMVVAKSRLPLPVWRMVTPWLYRFVSAGSYINIDLATYFPFNGWAPVGWPYGAAGFDFGPYTEDRWVYSHADDPAFVDDDLAINGVLINPNSLAGYIYGPDTTLLHVIPAGEVLNLNVWHNVGAVSEGAGSLRLYDRPI